MTSGNSKFHYRLVESQWQTLNLSETDVEALIELKDKWRTEKVKWFSRAAEADDDQGGRVIDVRSLRNGLTEVKVLDAIGAIDLPESIITVDPKIPIAHFSYIASKALALPRLYSGNPGLQQGGHFLELVCAWAIDAIDAILRDGLIRDYKEVRALVRTVRGRLNLTPTYLNIIRGNLALDCTFEDYSADNPLNRVLKHALNFISGSPAISDMLRLRAKTNLRLFGEVGQLRDSDFLAVPSRNSAHYRDAIYFARQVVTKSGVTLDSGHAKARSFLYKTPLLMEEGIRRIIQSGIAPVQVIKPKRRNLLSSTGKTVSANPDLGFGDKPIFIGDVKYKIQDDKWRRPDLAQSVFFAVAFDSSKSLIIDFENENSKPNGDLQVSQIQVSALGWNARSDSSPEDSAEQLVDKVKNWLEGSELLFVSELKVT